jgi:probable rRNA maturation factor
MIRVDVANRQKKRVSLRAVKQIAKSVLEREGRRGEVSLVLVTDTLISELNREYLDREGPTDVLAFPGDGKILGEIIISTDAAERQAREYGHRLEDEVALLVIHGALHLAGYNHSEEMEKKEREYLYALLGSMQNEKCKM